MTPALSFSNVSCRFDVADVVDGVSFDIQAGEIICLLGPSGCGKTTSLRLAAGMEVPSGGEIYLAGECVSTPQDVAPPEARGIGFLFQDFALFPHLSVYENVTFGLGHLPKEEQKARALELLNAVGLSGFASKYPNILSGGEQQRAALARAMAAKPKLVLMDEPFSNLDPQLRDQMRDLTLRLLRENGAAGLIVTHDAADALRMADRIAVQNKGQILQMDTPEAIYQNPVDLHVAAMFGPLNIMADAQTGGQIGVRPSDMALHGQAEDFSVDGDVQNVRAIGPDWLCDMALSDGVLWQALVRGGERPENGLNKFFVPRARLMLFKTQ
jgi:iron(III) transport system ATP-binding protein